MSAPPDDNERTVEHPRTLPQGSGAVHVPVTVPGHRHGGAGASDTHSLRLGTRLGEFELTKEIGEGGFSIVYLAWDHSLDRQVALKEYMPSSIATRLGATDVGARSERHRETFDAGLKSFINEAKLLARFDHPALVKVYRFWEANGTAYMVMPFYEGKTVKDTVRALPAPPDEAWLRGLLAPLTEALNVIHAERCYHRDIAPDNVILLAGSNKPLLLDFGAARRVIGDMTQALTVILKPGYAPVEQYAEVPGMKQGPWTDVYALAAVVYWAITGKTPPTSVGRMLSDTYVPLMDCAAGRYSPQFLRAIDQALEVLPERRTQSIDALRDALALSQAPTDAEVTTARWVDPEATVIRPTPPAAAPAHATAAQPPSAGAKTVSTVPPPAAAATSAPAPATAPNTRRRGPWMGGLAAAAAGLSLAAWWALRGSPEMPPAPQPVAEQKASAPPPVAATASPPARAPRAVVAPKSPAEAFASALAAGDSAVQVIARADPKTLRMGRDKWQINVQASQAGYVQVFGHRAGTSELAYLHPSRPDERAALAANSPMQITLPAWAATPPLPVSWQVLVIVSRQPRDLRTAGWQTRGNEHVRNFSDATTAAGPFWGSVVCPSGELACGDTVGVAELALDVVADDRIAPSPIAETAARPPDAPRAKAERPRPEAAPSRTRAASTDQSAECQRIVQRQSLGETSSELIERAKALGCR